MSSVSSLLLLAFVAASRTAGPEFWVDPVNGSDSGPGSESKPFATVLRAASEAAAAAQSAESPVTVWLQPAMYTSVSLNASHSGTLSSPITFRGVQAENGNRATLSGGVQIKGFSCPSGPSALCTANLTEAGISSFGSLAPGGLGRCNVDVSELFLNDQPLVLARYPNKNETTGYNNWMNIKSVPDSAGLTSFVISDPTGDVKSRAAKWAAEPDLWFHGYWKFDWADSHVRSTGVDASSLTVSVDKDTPPVYQFLPKARVMAENALCELDVPGEYYIDKDTGILSLIPPKPMADSDEYFLSVEPDCVLCVDGARDVHFRDFQVRYSRGDLVKLSNATRVTVAGVTATGSTQSGVSLEGTDSALVNSTIANVGCGAVHVTGGDTDSLTASGNEVGGNQISNFSRWTRTYTPGIAWSGVGHWVHSNNISDGPHAGILGGGNDCLFEWNRVQRVGFEVDDTGAFYTGRNWARRGNVARYNTFESIRTRVPIFLGAPSVQAIYLDDQMSGWMIYNNTFIDCQVGMFIGGGRRNEVKYNRFEQCDLAVHLDDRGKGCFDPKCFPNCAGHLCDGDTLWASVGGTDDDLTQVGEKFRTLPWATRYPEIPNIPVDGEMGAPVYTQIVGNRYCKCKDFFNFNVTQVVDDWRGTFADNAEVSDC